MACFVVSAAEAVVVTAVEKHIEKVEKEHPEKVQESELKIPIRRKLKWLNAMLWGGVILLALEHLWHGEIVPWFPFLTAMSEPGSMMEMFKEIATVGVCMSVLITAVWFVICKVADYKLKSAAAEVDA